MTLCEIMSVLKIPKEMDMENKGIFSLHVNFVTFNFHIKVNCWHLCMD